MEETYVQKIVDYNDSIKTRWQRFKRWFMWNFRHIDFCPRCEKPTKWEIEIFRAGDDPDGIPLFAKYYCLECGLVTGGFGPLIDAMEKRIVREERNLVSNEI